jgi:hypothetical protein
VFATVWTAIDELIDKGDLYSSVEVMREQSDVNTTDA